MAYKYCYRSGNIIPHVWKRRTVLKTGQDIHGIADAGH